MSQTLTYVIGQDRRPHVDNVQDFKVNFDGSNTNWVQARQYERSMRQVFVNIKNEDGTPLDLTGCNVWFEGLLPKNSAGDFRVIDDKGYVALDPTAGRFRFDMPGHAFTVAGSYRQAFFRILKDGNSITTLEFDLDVLADKVIDGLVPRTYISPIEELINEIEAKYQDSTDKLTKMTSDFIDKFTQSMNTLKALGATVQNGLDALEQKIKQDGLFTQAEADVFKQTITEKITELSNDVLHKTGDQTILDDNAGFALFKTGINYSINGGTDWATLPFYVTPAAYGAKGYENNIIDDADALQKALDDNQGKTLLIDKDYATSKQLKITDSINIIFAGGSLVAAQPIDSLLTVSNGTVSLTSQSNNNIHINLNNNAKIGIETTGGQIKLYNLTLGKLPMAAIGVDVSNHANISANNVTITNRFNGKQSQIPTGTIGIHLYSTWDNQLSNINTVEIQIGMWFEKTGNNFINYYHPWSVAPTIAGKTTGIKFGNTATDFNYFSHLYLDTCAKGMDFMNDTNVYINGLFNYFNSDYYNKSLNYPTPTLFYYEDQGDTGSGVHLIHGNLQNPKDMPVNFTNLTKLQTLFEVAQTQFDNYHNRPLVEDQLNYLSGGGDLNDITYRGNYKFYSDNNSGSFSNQPISNDTYFILEVSSFEGTNGVQRYYSTNTGNVYIRQWHRGSMYDNKYFYPWRKLEYFSDDK